MVIRRPPSPTKSATATKPVSGATGDDGGDDDVEKRNGRMSADSDDGSDSSGDSVEELAVEDYEISRLRRIRENELLLSELGIYPSLGPSASTSSLAPAPKAPVERQRKVRGPVYDRSGYIISRPEPGQTFRMACVQLPSDRNMRKKISDGEYQDCSHWAEGEERRWRYGDGEGVFKEGEKPVVGGVGPDFRWRTWLGVKGELRREMMQRGELNEMDVQGAVTAVPANGGVLAYSDIPGAACHQCRRRSEKLKMKCRNTEKVCNAVFCSTCCRRYNDFEFDPDSRSFICPLCRNVCNCSNCLRKRGLAHLLENTGQRTRSLSTKLKEEGKDVSDIQSYLEKQAGMLARAPFDRVRIVMQDEDVISPDLPPEPEVVAVRKRVAKKPKRAKRMEIEDEDEDEIEATNRQSRKTRSLVKSNGQTAKAPITIKFKIPRPAIPVITAREKEVDSDCDTVGDWSGEDEEEEEEVAAVASGSGSRSQSSTDSLSSISSREPTPPRRLAFPPRHSSPITSPTTAFLMNGNTNGCINPAMIDVTYTPQHSTPSQVAPSASGSRSESILAWRSASGSASLSPTKQIPVDLLQDLEEDGDEKEDEEQDGASKEIWKTVSPPRPMISGKKRKRPPPLANIVRSPRFLLADQATLPDADPIPVPILESSGPLPGEDDIDFTSPLNDTLFSADMIDGSSQPSPLSALFPHHRPAPAGAPSPLISAPLPHPTSPVKRVSSPKIDSDAFFQPTHMVYSLVQHFRVGSEEVEV